MILDTEFVRNAFPGLRKDYVFMDNAGGSQILKPIIDRIQRYWVNANVQHGAGYQVSKDAVAWVQEGKKVLANLVNAASPNELVMGGSSSLLLRLLSISIGSTLKTGDEIIVSKADHEANVSPWRDLAKNAGLILKEWDFEPQNFRLTLSALKELMTDRTRIVALCHCSNIFGAIHDIRSIADWVHQYEAYLVVDGVAYAPHRLIDVQALDVDFYIYSLYKTYGPHYALMYGKEQHWQQLPGLNHNFIAENDYPYKLEPGGPSYEIVYGMTGMDQYLKQLAQHHGGAADLPSRDQYQYAFDLIAAYEAQLTAKLLTYLKNKDQVQIIGPSTADAKDRVSTIAFVVDGVKSDEIVAQTDLENIGIRYGDFYAKNIIKDLKLESRNGVVRVSMVHYNTFEELDCLLTVFDRLF